MAIERDTDAPMSRKQAAAFLGVNPYTLAKWTARGLVACYRPNGRVTFYRKQDLEAWVYRNRSDAAHELAAEAQVMHKAGRK